MINDLAIILSLVIIGLVIWFHSEGESRVVGAGVIVMVLILFIYLFLIAPAQTTVVLDYDTLTVNIPPYAHEIVKKEEILGIRVVDLEYDESLQPASKKLVRARKVTEKAGSNWRMGEMR